MTNLRERALSALDDAQNEASNATAAQLLPRLHALFGIAADEIEVRYHEIGGERITYAVVDEIPFCLPPVEETDVDGQPSIPADAPQPVSLLKLCACGGAGMLGCITTLRELGQALKQPSWESTECYHSSPGIEVELDSNEAVLEGFAQLLQGPNGTPTLGLIVSQEDMERFIELELGERYEFALYPL